ncbi:carboxymuconolactone decarboxylase family protein [Streptomyces sp. APSN-46.1]|uniref:carboxymuconolactone decarboxylase family protein n=1 Tax=Streptomyces sp. APSN-46.1 TaxID=2929049 RepID=UPI001FB50B03|nr:carboxymuconolactone decarboxylase family protein [Streptomyces sp. APSN-46.1]MCJ1676171.1 carboxymuconolactone decarboxylase family protein [Streptomyces sp. APSN-46.1]
MSRVNLIDPANATGASAEQLAATQRVLGVVPNMAKAMAHSPAALKGFLGLFDALKEGVLSAGIQERIALVVAELNGCSYCLSAHTMVSLNVAKLSEDEIEAARRGTSSDPKAAAVLRLAVAITENRGRIGDDAFAAAHEAGLTNEEIVEVIANTVRNIFTNYVNEALDVDVEWPLVTPYSRSAA